MQARRSALQALRLVLPNFSAAAARGEQRAVVVARAMYTGLDAGPGLEGGSGERWRDAAEVAAILAVGIAAGAGVGAVAASHLADGSGGSSDDGASGDGAGAELPPSPAAKEVRGPRALCGQAPRVRLHHQPQRRRRRRRLACRASRC